MDITNCLETVITFDERKLFHYLSEHCIYLTSRQDESHTYQLHACDDFYVELRLDKYGSGIQLIGLFRNQKKLIKYLDTITLESISIN